MRRSYSKRRRRIYLVWSGVMLLGLGLAAWVDVSIIF